MNSREVLSVSIYPAEFGAISLKIKLANFSFWFPSQIMSILQLDFHIIIIDIDRLLTALTLQVLLNKSTIP
jgi:hypothetical protein